ncbi:hypothetical protein BN1184_AA_01860 [Pantoea ananatis]|nr:hypothetical protein BN1184_AA_01860 [Pantoea ananatis]
MDTQQTRQGIGFALGAYFIWGIAPAYFKLVKAVPATEIMTHRVIWSALFMLLLITLSRSWGQVRSVLRQPKKSAATGPYGGNGRGKLVAVYLGGEQSAYA